ncbi:(2Fe-2S)-binding protein [Kitasatospora sp. NPDC006697]|uniref:(2Fe-2S)-binding protein n=1 Tax=Kitasatospora sp. NPDC006697 TaxID=3364020 RepID=UPI003673C047
MTRRTPPRAATRERVAALGPFFAYSAAGGDAPWRSMGELLDDPAVLRDRVDGVRNHLATAGGQPPEAVELRVAASVAHLGLVARLISPAFAIAVLDGAVLRYSLRELHWQPTLGGAFPLALPDRDAEPADSPAEALAAQLLDGPVRELAAVMGRFSVSPKILRGNAASAVNGAVAAIAWSAPELAAPARALATALLTRPPLLGAASHAPDGSAFRRRSCCLIYRAAPGRSGALCGDCVLAGDRR